MSEQDRLDWNDDLDFESLADEQDAEGMTEAPQRGVRADAGNGGADDADAVKDAADAAGENQSDAEEAVDPAQQAREVQAGRNQQKIAAPRRRRSGMPAIGMGILFGFSTLVAGVGIGGALLLVGNVDPRSLWNPQALLQVDPWLNLFANPLHLLYVIAAAVVVLTVLISWGVSRFAAAANRNLRETENLLAKVTALRLGNDTAWQSTALKEDPAVEAFANETLGAWRLQQSRHDRNLALEGELRRLDTALGNNSRDDLAGGFEHPLVGQVAETMIDWYDRKQSADQEANAIRSKDQTESTNIVRLIQDARGWNRATLDRLGVQGASLARLAQNLDDAPAATSPDVKQAVDSLQELGRQLATRTGHPAGVGTDTAAAGLNELVDRGAKLAFQIAMEVSRLGSRGERLLPMTQSLEELNTEIREAAGTITGGAESGRQSEPAVGQDLTARVETVLELLTGPGRSAGADAPGTDEGVPAVAAVAVNLEQIAGSFNEQGERLTGLGRSFSELTGAAFDPDDLSGGGLEEPFDGGLQQSQVNPFGREIATPAPTPAETLDPFAASEPFLSQPQADDEMDPSVASVDSFLDSASSSEEPPVESTSEPGLIRGPELSMEPEPTLPSAEENVYDLAEFGAVRLDDPAAAEMGNPASAGDSEAERIYELSEFGAVALS